jgi:hypothetical protein
VCVFFDPRHGHAEISLLARGKARSRGQIRKLHDPTVVSLRAAVRQAAPEVQIQDAAFGG